MFFKAQGIITALVTPFDREERLDGKKLRTAVEFQLKAGVDGIFVCGSTGEAYSLEFEEKRELLEITVDAVQGRVPVYMGCGGSTTRQAVMLVEMAEKVGANAISIITPYFLTPNQEELYLFYKDTASSTSLPIIMYNHPIRTSVRILPETVEKLALIPNIIGIKDSSSDLNNNMAYVKAGGKEFCVLSGNDSMILSLLNLGGRGAVSASANFVPKLVCDLYREYCTGNREKAVELQYKLFQVRRVFNMGSYPVMIKEACKIMGIDVGECRKPVLGLNNEDYRKLKDILESL